MQTRTRRLLGRAFDILCATVLAFPGYIFIAQLLGLPLSRGPIGSENWFPFLTAFGLYIILALGIVGGRLFRRRRKEARPPR